MSDWKQMHFADGFTVERDDDRDQWTITTPLLLPNNDLVEVYWTDGVLTDHSIAHNEAWLMGGDAEGFDAIADKCATRLDIIRYDGGRFVMDVEEPTLTNVLQLAQCVAESVSRYKEVL